MVRLRFALPVLGLAIGFGAPSPAASGPTAASVDERVELLTIVARLAGAREFNMPNSSSPYADRVAAHFAPFKDHAVVANYQAFRRDFGVSYDAIPSLALHLDDVSTLQPRMPFTPRPARLDARWDPERTQQFLVDLRDFVRASDAEKFFASEADFYAKVGERLSAFEASVDAVGWFDSFFGAKPGATYAAIPGLLCGGGNFGVGVAFSDGSPEEIRPVLGCWSWTAEGLPTFDVDAYLPTYVHELCHSYTNPIVDRHAALLDPAASRIYPTVARRMERMAYGNPRTMLYETLVRACVIRFLHDRRDATAAQREAEAQASAGFVWVPDLAKLLDEYVRDRATYPTLDSFMPTVARFLDDRATSLVALAARTPTLVAITPANGAAAVDPTTTTLTLVFSRPMRPSGWSFVGASDDVPEFTGKPAYDEAGTTLSVPIRLVPGKTYSFSLNSDRFRGFTSADGIPLEPVPVRFTVAASAKPPAD